MGIRSYLCRLLNCGAAEPTFNHYGWKRDLPDHRDFVASYGLSYDPVNLPSKVDLRESGFMPPVYTQGKIGSCTGNSIAGILEFDRAKQQLDVWTPSRLFIYYHERLLMNTVGIDSGAQIRDGFKVISSIGYAKESTWPYDISMFTIPPSAEAAEEASKYKAIQYETVVQDEHSIKATLAEGFPIVFGIMAYTSFETKAVAQDGIMHMPDISERPLGGHCMTLVGYDDDKLKYIFRNSWGAGWGEHGYGYIPYSYVHSPKLASDFWVVKHVN